MFPSKIWKANLKNDSSIQALPNAKIADIYKIDTLNFYDSLPNACSYWDTNVNLENPTVVLAPHTIRLAETMNLAIGHYCTFLGVFRKPRENELLSHKITVFPCKNADKAIHEIILEFIDLFKFNRCLTIHVQGCYGIDDSFGFATVFTGLFKLLKALSKDKLEYRHFLENINTLSIKYPIFSDLAEVDVILTGSHETSSFSYFQNHNTHPFYGIDRIPCKEFFKKTYVFYVNVLMEFHDISYVRHATSYRYLEMIRAFYEMENSEVHSDKVNLASIRRVYERTSLLRPNSMQAVFNSVLRNLVEKSKISGGDVQPFGFFIFATEIQKSSETFTLDILQEFLNMGIAPVEFKIQQIFQGHGASKVSKN